MTLVGSPRLNIEGRKEAVEWNSEPRACTSLSVLKRFAKTADEITLGVRSIFASAQAPVLFFFWLKWVQNMRIKPSDFQLNYIPRTLVEMRRDPLSDSERLPVR